MKLVLLMFLFVGCAGLKPLYRNPSVVEPIIIDPVAARPKDMQECIERFLKYGVKFNDAAKECDERIYKNNER